MSKIWIILDIYILFISNNLQMIILPFIPILALLIQTSYSLYDILQSRNEVNEIEVQVLMINSRRKLIPKDFEDIRWLIKARKYLCTWYEMVVDYLMEVYLLFSSVLINHVIDTAECFNNNKCLLTIFRKDRHYCTQKYMLKLF